MTEPRSETEFEGWCVVELMGHRKLAGFARQVDLFGASMLRLDVPADEESIAATQFYSAAAIYCLTPTTEEIARGLARRARPEPVSRWELPSPTRTVEARAHDDDTDY